MLIADEFGVGDTYRRANVLVADRKGLEDESIKLFGRDLARSVVQQTSNAASQLAKGDASAYRRLMEAMPEHRRKDAAVAVIDQLFTMGSRNKDQLGGGFANAYRGLTRNKALLDELFKDLPTDAKQQFKDLGAVANAIYRAKAFENKSRTANAILAALDEAGGLEKLFKGAVRVSTLNSEVGGLFSRMISRSRSEAAESLLISPSFRAGIRKLAEGDVDGADSVVEKSNSYRKWANENPKQASAIKTIGFWSWLGAQDGE